MNYQRRWFNAAWFSCVNCIFLKIVYCVPVTSLIWISKFTFLTFSVFHLQQRHSQPDFDRSRPLSETNSELSYDALSEKPFKSSNDLHTSISSHRLHEGNGDVIKRNSALSQSDTSDSPRMTSGHKRNLPKHQRPLTRYLPIMSADLDLRQHIETAGHQVTLCPHVILDSYSCRG